MRAGSWHPRKGRDRGRTGGRRQACANRADAQQRASRGGNIKLPVEDIDDAHIWGCCVHANWWGAPERCVARSSSGALSAPCISARPNIHTIAWYRTADIAAVVGVGERCRGLNNSIQANARNAARDSRRRSRGHTGRHRCGRLLVPKTTIAVWPSWRGITCSTVQLLIDCNTWRLWRRVPSPP